MPVHKYKKANFTSNSYCKWRLFQRASVANAKLKGPFHNHLKDVISKLIYCSVATKINVNCGWRDAVN